MASVDEFMGKKVIGIPLWGWAVVSGGILAAVFAVRGRKTQLEYYAPPVSGPGPGDTGSGVVLPPSQPAPQPSPQPAPQPSPQPAPQPSPQPAPQPIQPKPIAAPPAPPPPVAAPAVINPTAVTVGVEITPEWYKSASQASGGKPVVLAPGGWVTSPGSSGVLVPYETVKQLGIQGGIEDPDKRGVWIDKDTWNKIQAQYWSARRIYEYTLPLVLDWVQDSSCNWWSNARRVYPGESPDPIVQPNPQCRNKMPPDPAYGALPGSKEEVQAICTQAKDYSKCMQELGGDKKPSLGQNPKAAAEKIASGQYGDISSVPQWYVEYQTAKLKLYEGDIAGYQQQKRDAMQKQDPAKYQRCVQKYGPDFPERYFWLTDCT